MDTLVALSYCGDHIKSIVGRINPLEHIKMLTEAAKRYGNYPVLVTATRFSIMDILKEDERNLAWNIYKYATVVSMRDNPGHQHGACWCIRMALEYADIMGFDYLFYASDDVLIKLQDVQAIICRTKEEKADYLGSNWSRASNELNSQVFCCKVKSFCDASKKRFLINPVEFGGSGMILERYLHEMVTKNGLRAIIHPIPYFHTHHPERFFHALADYPNQEN